MSEKREVSVTTCEVEYTDDGPRFLKAAVKIRGTITKDPNLKSKIQKMVNLTLLYDEKAVKDVLESAARTDWIRLQKVRDRDDFLQVVQDLEGQTVHVNDINDWTETGKGKLNQVAAFLMKTGKYTREEALEISQDPERKQKVLDWMASLETPTF